MLMSRPWRRFGVEADLAVAGLPRELLPEVDGHAHARCARRMAVADEPAAGVERGGPVAAGVAGEHVVGALPALGESQRLARQERP